MLKIFHPSDFSAGSELALVHALRLAVVGETELTMLHVETPDDDEAENADFPSVVRILERWDLLESGSTIADVDALGVRATKVDASGGEPLVVIDGFLREHPADLLVLATAGRSGLARLLKGSTAEPMSRDAKMMTLFVPHRSAPFVDPATGTVDLAQIVVPVSSEPSALPAIHAAESFSRALGVTHPRVSAVWVGAADACPILADSDVPIAIRNGDVSEQVTEFAREQNANLIVMTTKGHDSILDALRGSITEQVIREAPCPVLAVPAIGGNAFRFSQLPSAQ